MLKTLKKYFDFCNREDRNKLYLAVVLGVVRAIFAALRITAIAVVVQGLIEGKLTSGTSGCRWVLWRCLFSDSSVST